MVTALELGNFWAWDSSGLALELALGLGPELDNSTLYSDFSFICPDCLLFSLNPSDDFLTGGLLNGENNIIPSI